MHKKKYIYDQDEYHFVMVCPQYEDMRYSYFPENMTVHVSLNKFYSFISSNNVLVIIALAKYLYYAFKRRSSILEEYWKNSP